MIPLALGLLLVAQTGSPGLDGSERIKRALDWFGDPDPDVREIGRKELLAIGSEAIPHLEKLLELRNALDIYKVLREMDRARNPFDPKWVGALPPDEDIEKDLTPAERTETDRYVKRKYAEGVAAAKKHAYQRGYDVAHALLLLEPRSPYADKVQVLRRFCDNWLVQTSLVRSRVTGPASALAGDKPELLLRMENVFKHGVKIVYDRGTAEKPARALVVVEITCDLMDPKGGVLQRTRTMDVEVDPEIPIAMGAQWEKVFALDTGAEFAEDKDYLRVYTVGAWTQPMKLDYTIASTTKRILFEPAVIKVVPKKHEHLTADPSASLKKAIDSGTVNEVFIAAMLVGEPDRPQAVDSLVALLEAKDRELGKSGLSADARKGALYQREWCAHILVTLTGQKLGNDAKKWRAYADGLAKKK